MADKDTPRQPTESELREIMLRGETLRQQLAALEQQRELLLEVTTDARRSHSALAHLVDAKDGDEILVPLGAGAFVQSRLQHGGKALASLGNGVHAEVPVADARDRLAARLENLDQASSQLAKDLARVSDELTRVNAVLEAYYGG